MAGQLLPEAGQVQVDRVATCALDPADLRRDVAYLSQTCRLFYATLRENLLLGKPSASDEELRAALADAGGEAFLGNFAGGWDYQVLEGGAGMSDGQRQAVLLARVLLRNPSVLLLDEPTSVMDDQTERRFIDRLSRISAGRTLIIATHRRRILDLVDRLVVLDKGKIVLDGPRDMILSKMHRAA
jgi:ATP-binding cassette, subfamily C, bacterial LapB